MLLALSTATTTAEIALIDDRKVLFEKKWQSHSDEGEKLLLALALALRKLPMVSKGARKTASKNAQRKSTKNGAASTARPDAIVVVNGPGHFTGLRIGVTVANTLASSYGIPVFALSTFEYLERKIPDRMASKTALLLKAGGEYVAVLLPEKLKSKKKSAAKLRLLHLEKIAPLLHQSKIKHLATDLKPEEKKSFPLPSGVSWLDDRLQKTFARVVSEWLKENPKPSKITKPIYLRAANITQSKKPKFT